MRLLSQAVTLAAALALVVGCQGDSAEPTAVPPDQSEGQARSEAPSPDEAESEEAPEDSSPDDEARPTDARETAKAERAPAPDGLGAGVSKAAADKFKAWGVVHAFLGARVEQGAVISSSEAIVYTKDNHVGVTTDGGKSWSFIKHVTGQVLAVGGRKGGPYVVSGKAGYVAMSADGGMWNDLPRHLEDDLIAVGVSDSSIVAVGKRGLSVRYDKDGNNGFAKLMPDGFKAAELHMFGSKFLAVKGKSGYMTNDGLMWAPVAEVPPLPGPKKFATSKGDCAIGKVGKLKGVVCEVKGVGFGVAPEIAMVEGKGTFALSTNGGSDWTNAAATISGVQGVIGKSGGPFFAFGKKGGLAITRDGQLWVNRPLETTSTLNAGLMDGSTLILVGDKGAIVRSGNGGESWKVIESPVGTSFKQLVKTGGKLIASDGKAGVESGDGGKTWTEIADPAALEGLPAIAKPGACDNRLPGPGEACKFVRQVSTPLGLPNVKALTFRGDLGLAVGDFGLVAMTTDGGATWEATSGFPLKGTQAFATRGETIVALGKEIAVVSSDGGKSYSMTLLPKKIGKLQTAKVISDGSVVAAGQKGTILKATGNLTSWIPLPTYPKNKANYIGLYEVNGVLYATGLKGEIDRSENKGATWLPIATGVKSPILSVAGEGNTVVAVAAAKRGAGNLLLRSNDGGLHFFVQREVSHDGRVYEFSLEGGTLTYNDRVSSDFGATWTPSGANYWAGAVDAGDGIRLANYDRYKSKSRFYVLGPDKGDWTIVDSFFNNGARFVCDDETGCWMQAGGQVYRPL